MVSRRLLHWGPITALTIIFILFFLTVVTFFAWCPPVGEDSFAKINFVSFCIWTFLILKYFFTSSFLGPGHVPFKWKPETEEDVEYLQFCDPCQGYKAPRAHHCQTCKRCVMKMDHHCPWINNCVGHYNHKSFTLFLIYVVIGCSHASVLMILCVIDHLIWTGDLMVLKVEEESIIEMTHLLLICLFFGIGLSVGVTVAVSFLLYYQVKSIVKNETGIETWIVEKALSRRRGTDEIWIYPYDLGLFENISQVLTWSNQYVGDGMKWPTFEGLDEYTLTIEQLEQKNIKRNRTVIYKVIKEYNGRWFPLSFGLRTCYSAPWSEEKRIPVCTGDIVHATRMRKNWIYGEKESTENNVALGESHRLKGWLPRGCVEEIVDEGIHVVGKVKAE